MTLLLTGIGESPIPRIAREFRFAQGLSTGAGNDRPVVLVGNKTSAGSETVSTLGGIIESLEDCENRFGAGVVPILGLLGMHANQQKRRVGHTARDAWVG